MAYLDQDKQKSYLKKWRKANKGRINRYKREWREGRRKMGLKVN